MPPVEIPVITPRERRITFAAFGALLAVHLWFVAVGWKSGYLPGNEYRQTHTAITAMFIQRDHDFSLAYPTPLLGKPWSVPYEFPLYQWSVVGLSNATGLPLIQAARAVSAVCFYLSLPALWLLLGRLGVPGSRRLVVLGLVLACPLYIFYARAFLIETMALMFSLWFLLAYVTALERPSAAWRVAANVAGVGAGLVKVMTFMLYLIPAGLWTVVWLWRRRPGPGAPWGGFNRELGRVAAATLLPFGATWWWIRHADAIKALNLDARNLRSAVMQSYHFGTWRDRVTGANWAEHWRAVSTHVATPWVLLAFAICAVLWAGRWKKWVLARVLLFAAGPVIFPRLYAIHEYYFVANGVFLVTAMGLALCGLLETSGSRWPAWLVVAGFIAAQGAWYFHFLYPIQRVTGPGGTGLTEMLRDTTQPDEVLIIAGEDWSPIIPFYAQRRALMFRWQRDTDADYVRAALAALKGERIGALVLRGDSRKRNLLRDEVVSSFGLDGTPLALWRDAVIYVPPDRRAAMIERIHLVPYGEVQLSEAAALEAEAVKARIIRLADLPEDQRQIFSMMGPKPVRYAADFALARIGVEAGSVLGAHPNFRLWFSPPAGSRTIVMEYGLLPGAYEGVPRHQATDGVDFSVQHLRKDGSVEMLFRRLLNPRDQTADRGRQKVTLRVEIGPGDELLFSTGPGPLGALNRDWAYWGGIRIQ